MTDEKDDEKFNLREPAPAYGKKKYTIEEYLELERISSEKHEYYRGEILAMAGPKVDHSVIVMNLLGELLPNLKGKSCRPFATDTRLHIPENTLFTYPDIFIVCGSVKTYNDDERSVLNPSVIIEVLSKSTRVRDRGHKFDLYKSIPCLKEYILVDSLGIHIETFIKAEQETWKSNQYTSIHDIINIKAIDVPIILRNVYEDTKLLDNDEIALANGAKPRFTGLKAIKSDRKDDRIK